MVIITVNENVYSVNESVADNYPKQQMHGSLPNVVLDIIIQAKSEKPKIKNVKRWTRFFLNLFL